jgi:hypothetical protein
MNKLDYTGVDNTKGYPFTIDDIRFMLGTTTNKGIYKSIDNIASSLGNNRVLSGCVPSVSSPHSISPGWLVFNGEVLYYPGTGTINNPTINSNNIYFNKNTTTSQIPSNNKKYKLDNTDASFTYRVNTAIATTIATGLQILKNGIHVNNYITINDGLGNTTLNTFGTFDINSKEQISIGGDNGMYSTIGGTYSVFSNSEIKLTSYNNTFTDTFSITGSKLTLNGLSSLNIKSNTINVGELNNTINVGVTNNGTTNIKSNIINVGDTNTDTISINTKQFTDSGTGVDTTDTGIIKIGNTNGFVLLGKNMNDAASSDDYSSVFINLEGTYKQLYSENGDAVVKQKTISDIRLKNNIKPLDSTLSQLKKLEPISHNWNDIFIEKYIKSQGYLLLDNSTQIEIDIYNKKIDDCKDDCKYTEIGFIAQDVQKIFPDVVRCGKDGYLGIQYDKMIAILTKSIQEQQSMIEKLQEEINILKN